MFKTSFVRIAGLSIGAACAFAVTASATPAVLEQAKAIVQFLDEIAIAAAAIGALILADTLIWPFMTKSS